MKITIGWSMVFAKEQYQAKEILEKAGHTMYITDDIENYINKPAIKQDFEEELRISLEYDIMKTFFNKIANSDALLICNYTKKWITGYLGTSVLMEIGLAYYLNKKVFLLYEVDKEQNYSLEVAIINPTILDWDLSKIW